MFRVASAIAERRLRVCSFALEPVFVELFGKYKPFLLFGAATQFVGLFLMWRLTAHSTPLDVMWRLFVVGLGLGPSQSLFNIVAQRSLAAFVPAGTNFDLGRMEALAMNAQTSGKAIAIPPFVANAFAGAMSYVFMCSMVIVAIGFITIFFIPHIPLRGRGPDQASPNKSVQSAESAIADAAPAPADPAPMPQRESARTKYAHRLSSERSKGE